GRGGRHPMLARARFRDDTLLAHAYRQEHLSDRVVDLVGAGVQQVFTFQVDARAATGLGEPPREMERGGPAAEGRQIPPHLGGERRVPKGIGVGGLQLVGRWEERFRHVPPAVGSEPAPRNSGRSRLSDHRRTSTVFHFCTWATNARTFAGSLRPSVSTPVATSTAYG